MKISNSNLSNRNKFNIILMLNLITDYMMLNYQRGTVEMNTKIIKIIAGIAIGTAVVSTSVIIIKNNNSSDNQNINENYINSSNPITTNNTTTSTNISESKESYSNYIELTTENWKDYFEIIIETEDKIDAFGEYLYSNYNFIIKLKEPYYSSGSLQNTAIKLRNLLFDDNMSSNTHTHTFEFEEGKNQLRISTLIIGWEDKSKDLTVNDLKCIQIKGNIVY